MTKNAKIATGVVSAVIVVGLGLFLFFKFWFVYSEGVNEGDINYFQKEGIVFKTYEGKMIQSGFKNAHGAQGSIQSNEFKFSVVDEQVAQQLGAMRNTGVRLHWKRYLGSLPWRGNSQYVVDSVSYSPTDQVVPSLQTPPVLPAAPDEQEQ